jgi:hypothetical protein
MELANLVGHHLASALSDRSYDTRLNASMEATNLLVKISQESETHLREVVGLIKVELLSRSNANSRKGGLMLLGGISRAPLQGDDKEDIDRLIHVASSMLDDEDSSVRFAACECLYNAMSARVISQKCFQALFDCLCKIEGDLEIQASAASFDRSLREFVMTSHNDTDIVGIFQVVETRTLSPHNYAKQLSTGWLRFLRANFGEVFGMRLCKIVPALLSCLSHCSARDIEVSVDSLTCQILSDLESGLFRISPESSENLTSVMVKYARFQSSLSVRSRVLVFDFLRVLSPTISSSDLCANSLACVLSCICDISVPEDVRSAALRANVCMINHPQFLSSLKESSEVDIRDVLTDSSKVSSIHLKQVVPWIYHLQSRSLQLSPADYCRMVRSLWLTQDEASRREMSKVIEILLEHAVDEVGRELARVIESTMDTEFWHRLWKVILEKRKSLFPSLLKTFTQSIENNEVVEDILLSVTRVLVEGDDPGVLEVCDDIPYMNVLQEVSPISFIIVCVRARHYMQALNAFAKWHEDRRSFHTSSLAIFVDLFESELMYDQRMSLLAPDGRVLAELLTNIAFLADPDAQPTRVMTNRLHIASLSRSM